ncbi:hypothetical protein [Arthrobacter sp. MMS24-S77]
MTGAFGNALSASWLMELMTAQAIMSEKSMVLFYRLLHRHAPFCRGSSLRATVNGVFQGDSSRTGFVDFLQTTLWGEGNHVSSCAAPWFS